MHDAGSEKDLATTVPHTSWLCAGIHRGFRRHRAMGRLAARLMVVHAGVRRAPDVSRCAALTHCPFVRVILTVSRLSGYPACDPEMADVMTAAGVEVFATCEERVDRPRPTKVFFSRKNWSDLSQPVKAASNPTAPSQRSEWYREVQQSWTHPSRKPRRTAVPFMPQTAIASTNVASSVSAQASGAPNDSSTPYGLREL